MSEPDTIEYFMYKGGLETSAELIHLPEEGEKLAYSMFIGADVAIREIETNVRNGRTAVVIKDSYANAFTPWLAPHYEQIVMLDPRFYDESAVELIKSYDDVDVIFVNYVLSATFPDIVQAIEKMR
ncbi:hypothetical protein FACS1894105_01500 [Clostridia bacterium]|nr:hypothetical protein FACS1894105_01500 [Clostridia bacterium]